MIQYRNILVIQTAFIGDAILASSLIEKLHVRFPSAKISVLVRKGNESIYEEHPYLDSVLVWNKQQEKLKNLWRTLKKIRAAKFDCVINCHRFASSGLLTAFSGALHTAGYKQNPWSFLFNFSVKHALSEGKHETERYNQLIEDFTDSAVFKPKLYPHSAAQKQAEEIGLSQYICMAPASVWFTKQLPKEKWIELCNNTAPHLSICLIGAPGDFALCENIKESSLHKQIFNLAGKLSLLGSAALMKKAQMNFVNDSAPLHLCSAVDAPVTAFFCSTVPEFGFGPLSKSSHIVQVNNLDCRPCGVHGHKTCPKLHFKCGHAIELPIIR